MLSYHFETSQRVIPKRASKKDFIFLTEGANIYAVVQNNRLFLYKSQRGDIENHLGHIIRITANLEKAREKLTKLKRYVLYLLRKILIARVVAVTVQILISNQRTHHQIFLLIHLL